MSLKHLLNPDSVLCWIEYREATGEYRVSVEGNPNADYWTDDADDAAGTAEALAKVAGCAAIVASKAAESAAGRAFNLSIPDNS